MSETIAVPRDLVERLIVALNRNVLELPSKDEFLPAPEHECGEGCEDTYCDGMWVTTFGPHPLAEQLQRLLAPPPVSASSGVGVAAEEPRP